MMFNKKLLLCLSSFIIICTMASCDSLKKKEQHKNVQKQNQNKEPGKDPDVLASVNGVNITKDDLDHFLKKSMANVNIDGMKDEKNKKIDDNMSKKALEMIVQQELIRQKAVELGMERLSDAYQKKLKKMEAQLHAFERNALSKIFFTQEILKKASVSEEEMKSFFVENSGMIKNEYHLMQIFSKDDMKTLEKDLQDIKNGTPFEEVVKRKFPAPPAPEEKLPWDLGYLKWDQIPETWKDAIQKLKKGEISEIIKGPKNRYWIIKVADIRENHDTDFNAAKASIEEKLKNRKIEDLRENWNKKLKEEANIVYMNK